MENTINGFTAIAQRGRCPPHDKQIAARARLITTTPSVYPWMISMKIEVLEHYLGGAQFVDNREFVMLAGIKADLLKFELGDPNHG
jgi:hypothetical protein